MKRWISQKNVTSLVKGDTVYGLWFGSHNPTLSVMVLSETPVLDKGFCNNGIVTFRTYNHVFKQERAVWAKLVPNDRKPKLDNCHSVLYFKDRKIAIWYHLSLTAIYNGGHLKNIPLSKFKRIHKEYLELIRSDDHERLRHRKDDRID